MDIKRNIRVWTAIAYWITCIAWTSPIFSIDLTGLWQLEGEELHRYEHQVWTDYEDGTVAERDFVGVVDQPYFESRGYTTQFDGQIEATLTGKRICNDLFEMTFVATISADNKVEFTNTYPGGSERCYQNGAHWYFSWADMIGSFSGTYDPDKRVITGTFDGYQEWAYTECWENNPLFGYSHYSVESTNIITDGTFTITVRSVRFIDKEDYSREVFGATADGASEVVIEAGPLPPDVVDASQVIVTIPDDGGELLDDAILHAGIFRQTWKAPEDFVGKDPNPNLKKRKIDFQVYVNGVDLEVPEFNLYKPPVVLIHGIFSGPHMWGMMVHNLKGSGYLAKPIKYCNSCSFQENISMVGTQIKAVIKSAKEHDFEEPIVVKKADVVAHSMGGILVCLYIASGSYDDDVNRVISIGTPFSGSQFANYVLNLLMIMPPEDQRIWIGTIETGLEKFVQGSLFRGAVRDLQVGSVAINQFRNRLRSIDFPVPVYAITCDVDGKTPGRGLDVVYWVLRSCDWIYNSGRYFGLRNIESTIFGTNNTDFVVSFDSQKGGSSKYKQKNVIDHIHEADDDDVISQVKELLKFRISNFNKEGFKPNILGNRSQGMNMNYGPSSDGRG